MHDCLSIKIISRCVVETVAYLAIWGVLENILLKFCKNIIVKIFIFYIKIIDNVLLRTLYLGVLEHILTRFLVNCAILCVLEHIFRDLSLKVGRILFIYRKNSTKKDKENKTKQRKTMYSKQLYTITILTLNKSIQAVQLIY